MKLAGKVALITGASRGLGRAMATGFAEEGADLVLAARTADDLAETARLCEAHGRRALAVACDVTSEGSVEAMVDAAFDAFGRVDVLVNNAGVGPFIHPERMPTLADVPKSVWDTITATNLTGVFLCLRAALPRMGAGGSVISIVSISARHIGAGGGPYVAGKFMLEALTRIVAEEQRERGVRVNALCPGAVVETGFFANVRQRDYLKAEAEPDVIVPAAIFLASDESSDVTGETYFGKWFNERVAKHGTPPRHGPAWGHEHDAA